MGVIDDAAGDKGGELGKAASESSQSEADRASRSWTERALSQPGADSPFYVPPPPKWAARFALIILYVHYVGVPTICAAATIWIALHQKWLGAGMLLFVTVWFCYRGWNGLHGRTPYGPGNLPKLRRQLKD